MPALQAFEKYVDDHFDDMVGKLQELCRLPSVSAQGIGLEEMANAAMGLLQGIGAQPRLIQVEGGPPWVYGEIGAGARTVVFYNHYDVQPPEPLELWTTPPFAADIRDGKLYARGAADNKGDFVARVQAVDAYRRTVGNLPCRIVFLVEGEEEIGSPHLDRFVAANGDLMRGADGCLWEGGEREASGRLQLYCGLKGVCYVELRVRAARRDAHSSWATIIPNAAWRLVWALNTLKDEKDHITVDGLMERVAEPTETELEYLRAIPFDEEKIKAEYGISHFIRDLHGLELLKKNLFESTCTICGLVSGYTGPGSKTVLPNAATAKIDFRLVPSLDPQLVLDLLRKHLDRRGFEDIEIVPLAGMNPAKSDLDSPIVRAALAAVPEVYGADPIVYPLMAGSGPMYMLCQGLGVPAVSAGISYPQSSIHAPNESIRLEDFRLGIKYVGHLIARLGGG